MWKHFVKDYFSFTRKERIGVIIIVSIIVFLLIIQFSLPAFIKQKENSYKDFENEIARLEIDKNDSLKDTNYSKNFSEETNDDYTTVPETGHELTKAEVFYFDPNTTSAADWKRLGIKEKTISTIQKYLAKGGRFYKPEDIAKIWGMHPSDVKRLIPYVSIKNKVIAYSSFEKKEYTASSYSPKSLQPIDVNIADTTAFISLPGIGSKLSQRIIAFRSKLGGFYSISQVGETYLLPDSTFQKIKPRLSIGNTAVRKININAASVDEMKTHPYLRYNIANAIFEYRQQHGNYISIEEIKKIMLVTDDIFQKVAPYLSIQ